MNRQKYEHENRTDLNEAALLWDALANGKTQVDRFFQKIVPHDKSVLFGYADVTVAIAIPVLADKTLFDQEGGEVQVKVQVDTIYAPIKLRGIVVKSLKGKPHIDMPAEKGANGDYFDKFMPRSAALRAVLQNLIFSDPEVQKAVQEASETPAQETHEERSEHAASDAAPAVSADNPFADPASA